MIFILLLMIKYSHFYFLIILSSNFYLFFIFIGIALWKIKLFKVGLIKFTVLREIEPDSKNLLKVF